MSVVTTVVLITDSMDEETQKLCDEIAKFTWDGRTAWMGPEIDCCGDLIGGQKCAESDVRIAAFNHLPWDGFIKHLEQVDWRGNQVAVVMQSSDLACTRVWQP